MRSEWTSPKAWYSQMHVKRQIVEGGFLRHTSPTRTIWTLTSMRPMFLTLKRQNDSSFGKRLHMCILLTSYDLLSSSFIRPFAFHVWCMMPTQARLLRATSLAGRSSIPHYTRQTN